MTKAQNASSAFRFAVNRALAVVWGGGVALALYLAIIILGPTIEGRYWPVIDNYHLEDVRPEDKGGVSFVPVFTKERDCTYFGVSWFAPNPDGNLVRVQVAPLDEDATAPRTGPMGKREGRRQVIYPPEGTTALLGVMSHDCGLIWQTRTPVGPFLMVDGLPEGEPGPMPAPERR